MDVFKELKNKFDNFNFGTIWENEIVLRKNQLLKEVNTKDTNLYYVKEGSLRIFIETEKDDITFRLGYPSNFIGALDSIIADKHSPFGIQALKKCVLVPIKKSSFEHFLDSDSEHRLLWQRIMNLVILDQGEREIDLLTSTPSERYHRVLKRSPQLFQEIPNKYIASYLRMTPETLSRLKKS